MWKTRSELIPKPIQDNRYVDNLNSKLSGKLLDRENFYTWNEVGGAEWPNPVELKPNWTPRLTVLQSPNTPGDNNSEPVSDLLA